MINIHILTSLGIVHMIEDLISAIINKFKKNESNTEKNPSEQVTTTPSDQQSDSQIIEHHEVLYSDRPNVIQGKRLMDHKILFTDVKSVESDIDQIDKEKTAENGNVERRVDQILSKKKKKIEKPSTRKPANVIYVVSKPQPGQVKGDWAVRSHYKIFSHHRTKNAAIKKARNIALEKDATVLVQNTNGTFSNGFKPRKNKK